MNTENVEYRQDTDEIEINIKDIIQFLRENFKRIAIWAFAFSVVGAIYSLLVQNEFESKTTLMPEIAGKNSAGGLSALAGLAGFDLGSLTSSGEAVRPDLYPNILQSLPFALHLLKQKVYVSETSDTTSVENYFLNQDKSLFEKWFGASKKEEAKWLDPQKKSNTVELTKVQDNLVKEVLLRVTTTFDRKTGIINIGTKMPDPVMAANVARISADYLKEYVTSYRTEKTKRQVTFLKNQVTEAKQRYQNAESALAHFKDGNRFLVLSTPKVEEARLTADFMFAQNVFNDLTRQYEQAKIKVEEETPVFKVLEPAKIPLKRSEPKRTIMVIISAFLGMLVGVAVGFWPKIKEKIV